MKFLCGFLMMALVCGMATAFEYFDCTYTASDGSFYDLHLIRSHHKGERNVAEDGDGMKYYWNLCESIVDARYHTDFKESCPKHAYVCQQTTGGGTKDCGGANREIRDGENGPASGVTIFLSGGDSGCDGEPRKTTINVNCGTDSQPVISEIGPCHYNIRYSNRLACPRTY
eukprot:CAMPEP_0201475106 /NCGR_PEP_ID=MMETSP0151_2-20130828/575_1 /ASSEMBLY_ACC=CAM_ASM_000257 /TAXON_ID=200890 /ORGANISM="Paramoeba atlantica, Strain 621/1 / CCAP 1560/9" /LENGTH=170 /DNA_ID=CAMNT_0047855121 /DNA_START=82 /DNA_END=594 /DNA_ORIENTATION=+